MSSILLAVLLGAAGLAPAQDSIPKGARFVMSHFASNGSGGDERLYISTSPDSLTWTAINGGNPVWQAPAGSTLRDPTIIYDSGLYWVAYTSGPYGAHASFGLVKSSDLLNWTYVGEISTAIPGETDPLTWNPCFFRDGDGSVHILVSTSPINGSLFSPIPAMQSYEVHPVSADWSQWSAPVLAGLPSTNTNEMWVWKEGAIYHAIYVDFAQNGAQFHATSSSLIGGWQKPQYLGFGGQEGGMILKKPGGGYRLYVEPGNGAPPPETYFYSDCDSAFAHFTAEQPVQSSVGMRNGKMTAVPKSTTFAEWANEHLGSEPPAAQTAAADPDGDGLSNLLEYAFDLDPLTPDLSQAPLAGLTAQLGGNPALTLTFRAIARLSDATYTVESSPDLVKWNADAQSVIIQSATLLTDGAWQMVAQSLTPPGESAMASLRVKVTLASSNPAEAVAASAVPAADFGKRGVTRKTAPAVKLIRRRIPLTPRVRRIIPEPAK